MSTWPTPQEPKVVIDKAEYDAMRAELEAARGQIDHLQDRLSEEIELRCLARAALREVLEEPIYQSREVLDRWRRALGDAPGEGAR